MKNLLLPVLFGVSIAFAAPREDAGELLESFTNETDQSRRLDLISKVFVGSPYGKDGPLGEGPNGRYDQDPLYRFDTFDCTTYIETIMALALSRDVNEFEINLDNIRYIDGDVDYLKRNHFTDLQWIPENVKSGYMSEITHEVVKTSDIHIAKAIINYGGWLRSHKVNQIVVPLASSEEKESLLEELKALASNYSPTVAKVPYIDINWILKNPSVLNKIPTASIVNFVRPNWDLTEAAGTHQNISHQGFLFRNGKVLYLRHASTSGKVENIPFIDYLKRFQNHATMKGIHLMKLN